MCAGWVSFAAAQKGFSEGLLLGAYFSCSNVMALQWWRGQWKARPPRAVLGKDQQHLDGLQSRFTTGGIFSVLSLQNKNKSRDPGRPLSHSLSPICQSGCRLAIYPSSVCKLGILGRGAGEEPPSSCFGFPWGGPGLSPRWARGMVHPQRLDDVLPSGAETLARGGMNQADPGLSSVWAGTAALGRMGVKVGWEVSDLPHHIPSLLVLTPGILVQPLVALIPSLRKRGDPRPEACKRGQSSLQPGVGVGGRSRG